MTEFKNGDRVHVTFDATVAAPGNGNHVYLHTGDGEPYSYVSAEHCAAIRPPLAVGGLLTRSTPEPPIGTVLRDTDGDVWIRSRYGTWHNTALGSSSYTWAEALPIGAGNSTVLHVGGAE